MQAHGLFGERHIYKKLLEFPIPKFNHLSFKHKELVRLAKICKKKVISELPQLLERYKSLGYIREKIRKDVIPDEINRI